MVDPTDNIELLTLSAKELKAIWGKETPPHQTARIKILRENFIALLPTRANAFLGATPITPSTLQEIPPLAKDILQHINFPVPDDTYVTSKGNPRTFMHAKASTEIIQLTLQLAKESGLLRDGMDLPLRRLWYAFIKASLERGLDGYVYGAGDVIGQVRKPEDGDYTSAFSDIIKKTNLWYSDFGVKNPSATAEIKTPSLFPPILIGLEKRSYYDVLRNMASLLGFSIYSAGGQSKFAEQEVLAKRIKSEIFDMYPKFKNMDIYIISDYDPAGLDIAFNIAEHQRFYQKRFGKDVTTKRLAPLPKHYTEVELEQALYTVEKPTRARWNPKQWSPSDTEDELEKKHIVIGINENLLQEREDFELEKEEGLEVESLPDIPLRDILDNPPTDWDERDYDDTDGDWKGLTRMRFILFDELIENYGLDGALLFLLKKKVNPKSYWHEAFNTENLAADLINKGEAKDVQSTVSSAYSMISAVDDLVIRAIDDYTESDKDKVRDNIEKWLDDVVAKYTDRTHDEFNEEESAKLRISLRDKLYFAISRDISSIHLNFPEEYAIEKVKDEDGNFYTEDFEITIPEELVENIRPIVNWAKCMELNAEVVKEYLETVDIDDYWEIPSVRACSIDDEGNVILSEKVANGEDCSEYIERIKKLEFQVAQLKSIKSDLERQLDKLREAEEIPENTIEEYENMVKELTIKLIKSEDELKKNITIVKGLLKQLDTTEKEVEEVKEVKEQLTIREMTVSAMEAEIEELKRQLKVEEEVEEVEEREVVEIEGDPFAYIAFEAIENRRMYELDAQLDLIKATIATDPKALRRIEKEEVEKIEEMIVEIEDPTTNIALLKRMHSSINHLINKIKNMHLKLG